MANVLTANPRYVDTVGVITSVPDVISTLVWAGADKAAGDILSINNGAGNVVVYMTCGTAKGTDVVNFQPPLTSQRGFTIGTLTHGIVTLY